MPIREECLQVVSPIVLVFYLFSVYTSFHADVYCRLFHMLVQSTTS